VKIAEQFPTAVFFHGEVLSLGNKKNIQCDSYKGLLWKKCAKVAYISEDFFILKLP
jgi:hypothetical protein